MFIDSLSIFKEADVATTTKATTTTTAVTTQSTSASIVRTTRCPKCGVANAGKLSCCFRGGAWFNNCGDDDDSEKDHTWFDGVDACKSKSPEGINKHTLAQTIRYCFIVWYAISLCSFRCPIPVETVTTAPTKTAFRPTKTAFRPVVTVPTTPRITCPKCGTQSKYLNCCFPGGTWFNKCGNPGNPKYEHTWLEGSQACQGVTRKAQKQILLPEQSVTTATVSSKQPTLDPMTVVVDSKDVSTFSNLISLICVLLMTAWI